MAPPSPATSGVRWPRPRSKCSPRGARAPYAGAHPSRQASPRPGAHRRAPCAPATSSFVIRPSSNMTLHTENAYCKSTLQVFKMFHLDVVSVSCGYCKSKSRCCICCNGCTRMFQAFVPNVSLDVCCKYAYLNSYIAFVPNVSLNCIINSDIAIVG